MDVGECWGGDSDRARIVAVGWGTGSAVVEGVVRNGLNASVNSFVSYYYKRNVIALLVHVIDSNVITFLVHVIESQCYSFPGTRYRFSNNC